MAIEVRELVIKATIVPEGSAGSPAARGKSSGNNESPKEEIINICVEKILEIIKEKHVR